MTRNCLPPQSVCGCWWWCEVSERPCEGLTTGPGQQQPASSRVKQLGPLPAPAPACSMDRVFMASPLTGPGASSLPSLYTAEDFTFQHSQLRTLPCSKFFHVLLITRYILGSVPASPVWSSLASVLHRTVETKTDTRVSETPWWPGPAASSWIYLVWNFYWFSLSTPRDPWPASSGP